MKTEKVDNLNEMIQILKDLKLKRCSSIFDCLCSDENGMIYISKLVILISNDYIFFLTSNQRNLNSKGSTEKLQILSDTFLMLFMNKLNFKVCLRNIFWEIY